MPFNVEFFPGNRNRFRVAPRCDVPNCINMLGADPDAEPFVVYGVPADEAWRVRVHVACSAAYRDSIMAEVAGDGLGLVDSGLEISEARSMPFAQYWTSVADDVGIGA